ncbi:hypothetical protein ELE36_14205 [Pseudolysobacter antarcticus]|uniref:Glutaconyl-CoA decarboxylase subunit gamma n=1 Tax=Pseudolysobacter antarcticus TaxID=2511995 RepID=A0A411HLX9_9GAMM|nr:hypothetical protein [Pseudolysobacter antarcticus]QBB71414.1 hypothetical protein ELE36_14205 [Pseudolysobacter antarcticus]
MNRITRSLIPFALILALGACQKEAPPPAAQPAAVKPVAPTPPPTVTPAAAPMVAADAPIPVVQNIGVPECDDYLRKYETCISSKVPDAARAAFNQGLEQTRNAWRAAAASPSGKSALVTACMQAQAATKTAMTQYGCTDL